VDALLFLFKSMPFNNTDGKGEYKWINLALGKYADFNYSFELPRDFVNAKERWIVIRSATAIFTRTTEPFDAPMIDCYLVSDFVEHVYMPFRDSVNAYNLRTSRPMGYVSMCNDPAQKKK
jgi:hypothetical protein